MFCTDTPAPAAATPVEPPPLIATAPASVLALIDCVE